jgi:hypothetical protein
MVVGIYSRRGYGDRTCLQRGLCIRAGWLWPASNPEEKRCAVKVIRKYAYPAREISCSPDLQKKENFLFCIRKKNKTMQTNNRHPVVHVSPRRLLGSPLLERPGRETWIRMEGEYKTDHHKGE